MKLYCLGQVELEGSDFSRPVPLLLLSYLARSEREIRGEIADVFWPAAEKSKRLNNLSENLRKLRRLSEDLIEVVDKQRVRTSIQTDVGAFLEVFSQGAFEEAVALYRGPFLEGIERYSRITLGEELEEWIINQREFLQAKAFEAFLRLAEQKAYLGDFTAAADLALKAFAGKGVSYPSKEEYGRGHLLLMSGGRVKDADVLRDEAEDIYGNLDLVESSQYAKAQLAHSLTLPPVSSIFVGRRNELNVLRQFLLSSSRLITITGIGGVGKTELAAVFARTAGVHFRDGLFYIALETLPPNSGPESLLLRICEGLGLKQNAGDLFDSIQTFLWTRHALLILDNMEHLKAHGTVVARLLAACPDLRILVTSRDRLHLDEERLLELRGLPYRKSGYESKSLELFRRRAKLVGVSINDQVSEDGVKLVELVEGHPLAIKLAASWLSSTSLSDIVKRLKDGLEPLANGPLDDAERHRSIRAAFDFSYELISEKEKKVLTDLAVFSGPFSKEAATKVVGAASTDLRKLVDKSLLRFDQRNSRYSLHALLRHYAKGLQRNTETVHNTHAHYFLSQLQEMTEEVQAVKNEAPKKLSAVTRDLVSAWEWAVEQNWQGEIGETALPLMLFGNATSKMHWVGAMIEKALEAFPEAREAFKGYLLSNLAWCYLRRSNYEKTIAAAETSIKQLGDTGNSISLSNSLLALASARSELGEFASAQIAYHRALKLHSKDSIEWANVKISLAGAATSLGDYEQAEIYLQNAEKVLSQNDSHLRNVVLALQKGRLYAEKEKPYKALVILEEALDDAKAYSYIYYQQLLLSHLVPVHLTLDNLSLAEQRSLELRQSAINTGNLWREVFALCLCGRIKAAKQNWSSAYDFFLRSINKCQAIRNVPGRLHILTHLFECELALSSENAALLYEYLSYPQQLATMLYADAKRFKSLAHSSAIPSKNSSRSWSNLSIDEVFTLYRSAGLR